MITPNHPRIQHVFALSIESAARLDAIETKTDHITVTQPVALDTMESDITANTAKNTYPSADATKVGHITITQAVDLDTLESTVASHASAIPASLSARLSALEAKMEFIPKAFGRFTTADPAVLLGTSYNVASISRGATGQYSIVIDTDMTTANYTVMLSYEDSTATIQTVMANTLATTGFNIGLRDASNAFSDASESVSFAVYENNT